MLSSTATFVDFADFENAERFVGGDPFVSSCFSAAAFETSSIAAAVANAERFAEPLLS